MNSIIFIDTTEGGENESGRAAGGGSGLGAVGPGAWDGYHYIRIGEINVFVLSSTSTR